MREDSGGYYIWGTPHSKVTLLCPEMHERRIAPGCFVGGLSVSLGGEGRGQRLSPILLGTGGAERERSLLVR